jgi:Kef-type K+ transport system membrane component KefB
VTVAEVLRDVLVVLIAAKVAAEASERIGVPAVVGEIVAGIVIGPSALHFVGEDQVLRVLGELGVILLLLEVGLGMDLAELGAVGRSSLLVAVAGVIAPFALGYGASSALGEGGNTALYVGAALTATSVGVTARVFGDLRALASVEARTVLGAAVADDVIGLVILTVVVRIVSKGTVSVVSVAGIAALAVAFLAVTVAGGIRLAPPLFDLLHRLSRSSGTLVAVALAFTLGVSELASAAKLAPIVGAFVAGLALARSRQADRIRRELAPVGHLFIPVFFLQIGIDARIEQFVHPDVLALAGLLLAAAVVGKLVSPIGALGAPGDKVLIGLGMLPRGEVGLIFATLGLESGVLGQDLYAALLLVVLATTLVTPPLLRWRLSRISGRRRSAVAGAARPAGGWLQVVDGTADLAAEPPAHVALHVALQAALLLGDARPGPRLLDWLSSLGEAPVRWDPAATAELLAVLDRGTVRSWRFLELSGMLDRALPELAESMRRRSSDPFELDPTRAVRWELLERLKELRESDTDARREWAALEHPERLLLAALVIDATVDEEPERAIATARRLVGRLGLGAAAEEDIALLVGERALFTAMAARRDALEEEQVLQLAVHLATPERARALYLLSLAIGDLDGWHRQQLHELHRLVQEALAQHELTGREARNVVERRRIEATRVAGDDSPAAARIEAAPRAFLLWQPAADLARQATMLEPLPPKGAARVAVTAGPEPGRWKVDVGSRDQPALLATVTGALAACDLTVMRAAAATWGDGGAVDAFVVAAASEPDAAVLQDEIERRFGLPLSAPPVPDADVMFDEASPWYTICEVRAADRPGLLHAFAVALSTAGTDVHSARVETTEGMAVDRFELTDRNGRRLDDRHRAAVSAAIRAGVRPSRRGRTKLAQSRNTTMTDGKPSLSTVSANPSDEPRRQGCDDGEGGGRESPPH